MNECVRTRIIDHMALRAAPSIVCDSRAAHTRACTIHASVVYSIHTRIDTYRHTHHTVAVVVYFIFSVQFYFFLFFTLVFYVFENVSRLIIFVFIYVSHCINRSVRRCGCDVPAVCPLCVCVCVLVSVCVSVFEIGRLLSLHCCLFVTPTTQSSNRAECIFQPESQCYCQLSSVHHFERFTNAWLASGLWMHFVQTQLRILYSFLVEFVDK